MVQTDFVEAEVVQQREVEERDVAFEVLLLPMGVETTKRLLLKHGTNPQPIPGPTIVLFGTLLATM